MNDNVLLCGRCYDIVLELHRSDCADVPLPPDAAIGQYHCPDCGAMLVAGLPHPWICAACANT